MKLKKLLPQKARNLYHLLNSQYYNYYFGRPSKKLQIIGITGTDGKTTTSTMLYHILSNTQKKAGLVTTISAKIGEKEYPVGFHVTTPDPRLMQKFLRDMLDAHLDYAVVETTSHGLDQHRVGGIKYTGAVYTNVTREHLDYHKTYENYLRAKMRLIDQTKKQGFCVVNLDDKSAQPLIEHAKKQNLDIFTYSIKPANVSQADFVATSVRSTGDSTSFTVHHNGKQTVCKLNFPGLYNVSNALAAIAAAAQAEVPVEKSAKALETLQNLEGRWEVMQEKPFHIVVDFAHTPNALDNVLQIARQKLNATAKGRIIVIFGCAGLRDAGKRPLMGAIAGSGADITILTAEDPRTEKVSAINAQIIAGLVEANPEAQLNKDYFNIEDRKEAIATGIQLARPGDIVIVTGKGHEKSMNLNGKNEIPWSDQEVINNLISGGK